jgi:hypothetical protein
LTINLEAAFPKLLQPHHSADGYFARAEVVIE